MRTKLEKLIDSNAATIFLFLYGLIAQIVALPVIFFFITKYPVKTSFVDTFVFLWFCIPVISVFSIIIAIIQSKKRAAGQQKYRVPLIGLILNLVWLLWYLFMIYMVFVVKIPFIFTK